MQPVRHPILHPSSRQTQRWRAHLPPLAACLWVLCLPAIASAQSEEGDAAPPLSDDAELGDPEPAVDSTIYVLGGREDILGVPGSGAVVTGEEIREQSYDDPNQALRRVPGVYIRQEDGFGLFPNLSLRGVDSTRSAKVTVMEDGILTAPAPYSAPSAYYSPTTGRMDQIEVLKGSSQVLYGPHTTGGVINYVSTPIPDTNRVFAKVLIGSHDELRAHLLWGQTIDARDFDEDSRLGRFGFLIEAFARTTGGFKEIDTGPDFLDSGDTGFDKIEPMLRLFWEPDLTVFNRLEFKIGYTDLEAREGYVGLSEADFSRDPTRRYAASRFDNIQTEQQRTYLRYQLRPTTTTDWTTTLYYNSFGRDWFKLHDVRDAGGTRLSLSRALAENAAHLATLRGEAAGELRVRHNAREYHAWGLETRVSQELELFGMPHTLTAGARYHEDRVRRDQQDEMFTQAANGSITAQTFGAPGGAGNRRQDSKAISVYVQDGIEVTDAITLTPGVRYEHVDQSFRDFNNGQRGESQQDVIAGGLGATWRLLEELELFAGVYRGFSIPSPRAASRDGLDEETSIGAEIGPRFASADGVLSFEAALFFTRFEDLIVIDNIGGTGTGDTENLGTVNTYGVELGASYDLGRHLDLPFRNPWHLGLTWTEAELRDDSNSGDPESIFAGGEKGNRVPYIPELAVSFGTGFEIGPLDLGLSAYWVDSTFTSASNTSSQVDVLGRPDARFGETDSYVLLDLSASWEVTDGFRVFGGVQNVLDDEYVASRHPHGPRPGAPLFAYVGLEIDIEDFENPWD